MNKKQLIKQQKDLIKLEMQNFFATQNLQNSERAFSTLENYVSRNIVGEQASFRIKFSQKKKDELEKKKKMTMMRRGTIRVKSSEAVNLL